MGDRAHSSVANANACLPKKNAIKNRAVQIPSASSTKAAVSAVARVGFARYENAVGLRLPLSSEAIASASTRNHTATARPARMAWLAGGSDKPADAC